MNLARRPWAITIRKVHDRYRGFPEGIVEGILYDAGNHEGIFSILKLTSDWFQRWDIPSDEFPVDDDLRNCRSVIESCEIDACELGDPHRTEVIRRNKIHQCPVRGSIRSRLPLHIKRPHGQAVNVKGHKRGDRGGFY